MAYLQRWGTPFLFDENGNFVGVKQPSGTDMIMVDTTALATALTAQLTGTLSGSDTTHAPTNKAVTEALALKADLTAPAFVSIGLPAGTPVNATATTLTIAAADLAVLETGDVISFGTSTFTQVAGGPGAGEYSNATELAALFDALTDYTGAESTGAVVVHSVALGTATNGQAAQLVHVGDTTSGGGPAAKSAATLAAAELARLALGDQVVSFDISGFSFTKAAATNVGAGEFADTAGLILCIDGLTDWAATASGSDIAIEAAAVGAEYNDKEILIVYHRTSTGAVNGTAGVTNAVCADANYLYHSIGASTTTTANWRRIARGSVY